MRIRLPDAVAAFIASRIAGYAHEAPEGWRWHLPHVAEFGALPVYAGWTETIGLRPNGEMVRWSTEAEYQGIQLLEDPTWALIALVNGASRYAELRALLPTRGPAAVDCPCRKHPLFGSGKVVCPECAGLGWLGGDHADLLREITIG
jgi:hypothetical protein